MVIQDLRSHYRALWRRHGRSPHALQWSSTQTQVRRFEALAAHVGPEDAVLDVGCGLGDLAGWLCAERGFRGRYTGVDFVEEFVEAGCRDERAQIEYVLLDVTRDALPGGHDWCLASGIFNNAVPDPQDRLQTVVGRMFAAARRGASFNLLSTHVDWRDEGLHYHDPAEVFAFCKSLSPFVQLDHAYRVKPGVTPFEFTVHLFADAP